MTKETIQQHIQDGRIVIKDDWAREDLVKALRK